MRQLTLLLLCLVLAPLTAAADDAMSWPREMTTAKGIVTMYQPQIDSYDGVRISARAAVSVTGVDGRPEPVFGAVWIDARTSTDRDARTVEIIDITIPNVRFPEATDAQAKELASFLQSEMSKWELVYPLDEFVAELDEGDERLTTDGLNNDPPVILYRQKPSVLVTIDGDPIIQKVDAGAGNLEHVVNSPFLIARETGAERFYLSTAGHWYEAAEVLGPWTPVGSVPPAIAAAVPDDEGAAKAAAAESPPAVVVATVPTELIVSDGPPKWAAVEGMDLLYMDNTSADVFLDIKSQYYYVVLAGRWYRAPAVQGDLSWSPVANDALPSGFADIPEKSVNADVLPYVAGTDPARAAALDNAVPQTAAVARGEHAVKVEYDGQPQFQPVENVQGVTYAVNTPQAVFRMQNQYYICEEGIWYVGPAATGPWQVATSVPPEIYQVPPSNPHYNVTYVRIYDVTPQVVYVGYTPGYLGSYYYHGAIVWGTGWYYRPWWRTYYYPRPVTYGFRVHYNPWTGWGFGVALYGPYRAGVVWGRYGGYGWFGVGGFRPYPVPYVRAGYRKTNININRNTTININRPADGRPGWSPANGNIYGRAQNRDRIVARPSTGDRKRPNIAGNRANNVLTDRSGNVYRRGEGGDWQQRDGGKWKPANNLDRSARPAERPAQQPAQRPTQRPVQQPAQRPEQRPTQRPAQQPAQRPEQRPTQRPAQQPAQRPAQQPVQRPAQQPAQPQRPTQRPVQQPAQRPAQSIVRPSPQPAQRPTFATNPNRGLDSGRRTASNAATRPQLERDYSARVRGSQRAADFQRSRGSAGSAPARRR